MCMISKNVNYLNDKSINTAVGSRNCPRIDCDTTYVPNQKWL